MKIPFLKSTAKPESVTLDHRYLALLEPLQDAAPCGIDLEYHPDLLVLQTKTTPQHAAQYGDFVAPADSLNWREIETALIGVLQHGKDIRALILLLRSRVQQAGAKGAFEGLYVLAQITQRYAKDIHPQHTVDGELDPGVRANALAALTDDAALLADLRHIVIDTAAASRLTLRDVERSMAIPRANDAPSPESLSIQLNSLWAQQSPALLDLQRAHEQAQQINAWAQADLGHDAPNLLPLLNLLAPFANAPNTQENTAQTVAPSQLDNTPAPDAAPYATPHAVAIDMPHATPTPEPTNTSTPMPFAPSAPSCEPQTRADALALVRKARLWFEHSEPSSPVADLLRQAEKLTGKSYLEIADAIPLDLLARWRQSDAAQSS